MKEMASNAIDVILDALRQGPMSINQISASTGLNWRTALRYLKVLEGLGAVFEKDLGNTRTFFLKQAENYFSLYVRPDDAKMISTFYYHITEENMKRYGTRATKTHAYKILWKLDRSFDLGLPIGWYKFGPCCVVPFTDTETKVMDVPRKQLSCLRGIVTDFCGLDRICLQDRIYNEEKEHLYIAKEGLLSSRPRSRDDLNQQLMDIIKYSPSECVETATDFARATLLLGWERMRPCFDGLWEFIAMIRFRDSLRAYYGDCIDLYFGPQVLKARTETEVDINDIVRGYAKPQMNSGRTTRTKVSQPT